MGVDGAELLRQGYTPEEAAAELEYASASGLVKLAMKYGNLEIADPDFKVAPPTLKLSQRVMTTVRHWLRFARGDGA